jgi:hypothetical protein
MSNRLLVVLAAAVIVVLAPGRASAHDLKVTVKVQKDAVVVEAGFDDDTPAEDAAVVILDAGGKEVAQGRTNERGVCRLSELPSGIYTAEVELAGHRDVVRFEVAAPEFLDAPVEYIRSRPNKTIGLAAGVGALLVLSLVYWWVRLRKTAR